MALVERIKACPKMVSLTPVTSERIKEAEEELGVTFANDYKEYTEAFGAASFNGHELTGICGFRRLDVRTVTKENWKDGSKMLEGLYVIEVLGIDGITVWQDGKGNVFELNGQHLRKIANSLEEYCFD